MVKVRVEDNTGDVNEMVGRFTWGAIETDEHEVTAFAMGRTGLQLLATRMAHVCTDILLSTYKVKREDPASRLIKMMFVKAIDEEFSEKSHVTETLKESIKKVEE